MQKNLISYFLFLKLISFSFNFIANDKKIDNCDTFSGCKDQNNCQPGEIKKCQKCKDKYFLFLNGFACIPCDDQNLEMLDVEENVLKKKILILLKQEM